VIITLCEINLPSTKANYLTIVGNIGFNLEQSILQMHLKRVLQQVMDQKSTIATR